MQLFSASFLFVYNVAKCTYKGLIVVFPHDMIDA